MRPHPPLTPPRPIMGTHSMGALLEGSLMDLKQMGPLFWDLELKVMKESSLEKLLLPCRGERGCVFSFYSINQP